VLCKPDPKFVFPPDFLVTPKMIPSHFVCSQDRSVRSWCCCFLSLPSPGCHFFFFLLPFSIFPPCRNPPPSHYSHPLTPTIHPPVGLISVLSPPTFWPAVVVHPPIFFSLNHLAVFPPEQVLRSCADGLLSFPALLPSTALMCLVLGGRRFRALFVVPFARFFSGQAPQAFLQPQGFRFRVCSVWCSLTPLRVCPAKGLDLLRPVSEGAGRPLALLGVAERRKSCCWFFPLVLVSFKQVPPHSVSIFGPASASGSGLPSCAGRPFFH